MDKLMPYSEEDDEIDKILQENLTFDTEDSLEEHLGVESSLQAVSKHEDSLEDEDELFEEDSILTPIEQDENTTATLNKDKNIEIDTESLPFKTDVPPKEASSSVEQTAEKKHKNTRYSIIVIAILAIILIVGAVISYFVFFPSKEVIPTLPMPEVVAQPEPPAIQHYTTAWEPFLVDSIDKHKEQFITLAFTTSTTSEKLVQEIEQKKLVLRDAIYYYLRAMPIENTKKTIEKIKKDIIEVINTHCVSGKVDKIGIEIFLIQ